MRDPGSNMLPTLPFSLAEYKDRITRTSEVLQASGTDVLVAYANKVMPGHVRYLSGYETRHGIHDWSAVLLEPTSGRCALLTNVSWEPLSEMTWISDFRLTNVQSAGTTIAEWM